MYYSLKRRRSRFRNPFRSPDRASDYGGVTMIVAVLLGCGVLAGTSAIVVDVGQMYVAREELQSGTDAAALAVAKACASGSCSALTTAQQYVAKNVTHGTPTVTICGSGINGLSGCSTQPSTSLAACLTPPPSGGTPYVEVRATLKVSATFAKAMQGKSGYDGTNVGACARAGIGKAGRVWEANSIALMVWVCYWSMYTKNGVTWVGYNTTVDASREQVLYLNDTRPNGDGTNNTSFCVAGPGGNNPGNFVWLKPSTNCKGDYATGSFYNGDLGATDRSDCRTFLDNYYASKAAMMLPLYDDAQGTGPTAKYHIAGYAAFVVTGYYLTNGSKTSWLTNKASCSGTQRCLYGYFTHENFTTDVIKTENGTDFGAVASGGGRITA